MKKLDWDEVFGWFLALLLVSVVVFVSVHDPKPAPPAPTPLECEMSSELLVYKRSVLRMAKVIEARGEADDPTMMPSCEKDVRDEEARFRSVCGRAPKR